MLRKTGRERNGERKLKVISKWSKRRTGREEGRGASPEELIGEEKREERKGKGAEGREEDALFAVLVSILLLFLSREDKKHLSAR